MCSNNQILSNLEKVNSLGNISIIGLATLKATEHDGKTVLIYVAIQAQNLPFERAHKADSISNSMAPEFAGLLSVLMISFRSSVSYLSPFCSMLPETLI